MSRSTTPRRMTADQCAPPGISSSHNMLTAQVQKPVPRVRTPAGVHRARSTLRRMLRVRARPCAARVCLVQPTLLDDANKSARACALTAQLLQKLTLSNVRLGFRLRNQRWSRDAVQWCEDAPGIQAGQKPGRCLMH